MVTDFGKEDEGVDGRRHNHCKDQQLAFRCSGKAHNVSEAYDLKRRDGIARSETQGLIDGKESHHGKELDGWVTHVGCEVKKGRRVGCVVEDVQLRQRDFFGELQRAPVDDLERSHHHHLCDAIQLCVIERKRDYVPSSWCRFPSAAEERSRGPSEHLCRKRGSLC